jgi:hypothetical protein
MDLDSSSGAQPAVILLHTGVTVSESGSTSGDAYIIDTGVDIESTKVIRPAPFYAKILGKVENRPGTWNSVRIGVFKKQSADSQPGISDVLLGEYVYHYPNPHRAFHPFKLRGNWYALYSSHYTATRLMSLPDCKDIGGEEPHSGGFCPVDFWVPPLHYSERLHDPGCPRDTKPTDFTKPCTCSIVHRQGCPINPKTRVQNQSCICKEEWDEHWKSHTIWHLPERVHGFVAGCVWGDDSSWKIEYLDLSKADEGVLKREARFGYIKMPDYLYLDKAIHYEMDDEQSPRITIDVQRHFNLYTGKESTDDDEA